MGVMISLVVMITVLIMSITMSVTLVLTRLRGHLMPAFMPAVRFITATLFHNGPCINYIGHADMPNQRKYTG